MSLPWFPMTTTMVTASIRKRTHTSEPERWVIFTEIYALAAHGELAEWSQKDLASRWCISEKRTRNMLRDALAELGERTETALVREQVRTALAKRFPALVSADALGSHSDRTETAPRARSSSESKKKTKSETPVDGIWSKLEAVHKQHVRGGRTWPTAGKTANARRKAITTGLRDLKSDGHEDPEAIMLATVEWMFTSDHSSAKGCRNSGGVDSILRPSNLCRLTTARMNVAATPSQIDPSAIFDRFSQAAKRLGHTATPDPDAIHPDRPTALRAWDCLKASGGWVSLCNANPYEVSQMRRSFIQSWGIAA